MYICTSEFVSFKCIQYSTWCQNRGCICISLTRRTCRLNPAVSCTHSVIQTRNIILQTELFLQEEGKRDPNTSTQTFKLQSIQGLQVKFYSVSTRNPVIPCKGNYSTYRINSSTRNLQEILQLQGSSHAGRYKASSSKCSPCIQAFYMAENPPGHPIRTPRLPFILPTETAF